MTESHSSLLHAALRKEKPFQLNSDTMVGYHQLLRFILTSEMLKYEKII